MQRAKQPNEDLHAVVDRYRDDPSAADAEAGQVVVGIQLFPAAPPDLWRNPYAP